MVCNVDAIYDVVIITLLLSRYKEVNLKFFWSLIKAGAFKENSINS